MKRIVLMVIAIFALMISLSSCNIARRVIKKAIEEETTTEVEEKTESVSEEEEETTDEPESQTEAEIEDIEDNENDNVGVLIDTEHAEVVLNDDIIAYVERIDTSFYPELDAGPTVEITIENNSGENLNFYLEDVVINDFHMPTTINGLYAGAGEKITEVLRLVGYHTLEGVLTPSSVKKMDFVIAAYTEENWLAESDVFSYAIDGEDGAYIDSSSFVGEPYNTDQIYLQVMNFQCYEDKEMFIIPVFYEAYDIDGYTLAITDMKVNGEIDVEPFCLDYLLPNTNGIFEVVIYKADVGEDIKDVSFQLGLEPSVEAADKVYFDVEVPVLSQRVF